MAYVDGFLIPVVSLLLRLVQTKHANDEALRIPGFSKAAPIVARFASEGRWQPPTMKPIWGAYFGLSESDRKAKQERVLAAYEAGVITEQTAIEELATLYPTIGDPAQYLKALQEERQKKLAALHDAQATLENAGQAPEVGDEDLESEDDPIVPVQDKPAPKKPNFRSKGSQEQGKTGSIRFKGKVRREVTRSDRGR